MDSGLISSVYKARRYAEEPTRFSFEDFSVKFKGENRQHTVSFHGGKWTCDCETFRQRSFCSHTMATERLLEGANLSLVEAATSAS